MDPLRTRSAYDDTLDGLRDLEPDWDSYGSKPVPARLIEVMRTLVNTIAAGEADVVPCPDGGVQVEVHRDGMDIEIELAADGDVIAFWEYDL